MASSRGSSGLEASLRILRRLLDGEELSVADVIGPDGQRGVQNRRLQLFAEHLPWVQRDGGGRGVTQKFRWVWPTEQQARPEQVWSLAAARTMLDAFRDSEVGAVLAELLEDHIRRLPGDRVARDDLDRMFHAATRLMKPSDLQPDLVDRLSKAITERRTVSALYTQFGGTVNEVLIEPWTLVFADEGPYLYGQCLESTKLDHILQKRIFNVARMAAVRLTDQRFVYPLRADHDPAELFRNCFTVMVPADPDTQPELVILKFDSSMRSFLVKHAIHPSQESVEIADSGHVIVKARLHITYDVVRWVRGHGRTVDVLAPVCLRDWVVSGAGGEGYKLFVLNCP